MPTLTQDELQEGIERAHEIIDATLDRWDRIPPDRKPYYRLAIQARIIGLYRSVLGDREAAFEWLGKSAEWYLDSYGPGKAAMLVRAQLTAVLARDDALMAKAAEMAHEAESGEPTYFDGVATCLSSLIRGDDEATLRHADALTDLESTAFQDVDYYDGLGTCCRAIATGDESLLETALETVLERHETLIPKLGDRTHDAQVCIPAAAIVVLARQRGLDVDVESEYLPETLIG
ncbi:Imm49 family immunity protein [Halobacteriaceae archaeon GCM10025711]